MDESRWDPDLIEILEAPLVEWQQRLATLSQRQIVHVGDLAELLVVRAARLAAYAEYVAAKQGHERAVKAQNKRATKVRRAMGFAYPKDDLSF